MRIERERSRQAPNWVAGLGDQRLIDNYQAFKKILMVLSLTITLDIIGPIQRFARRRYLMPVISAYLDQTRVFAFVFEGWAYGLLNAKLRAAYKRMLCGRSNRVVAFNRQAVEVASRGQQIFTIMCGKSQQEGGEGTPQEAQIRQPRTPSVQDGESNGDNGMDVTQGNETPIPHLQLPAYDDTDRREASGDEDEVKVSCGGRKRETSTVAGERASEEEDQGSSQGRVGKQRQVMSSDVVVISLEDDSVQSP